MRLTHLERLVVGTCTAFAAISALLAWIGLDPRELLAAVLFAGIGAGIGAALSHLLKHRLEERRRWMRGLLVAAGFVGGTAVEKGTPYALESLIRPDVLYNSFVGAFTGALIGLIGMRMLSNRSVPWANGTFGIATVSGLFGGAFIAAPLAAVSVAAGRLRHPVPEAGLRFAVKMWWRQANVGRLSFVLALLAVAFGVVAALVAPSGAPRGAVSETVFVILFFLIPCTVVASLVLSTIALVRKRGSQSLAAAGLALWLTLLCTFSIFFALGRRS